MEARVCRFESNVRPARLTVRVRIARNATRERKEDIPLFADRFCGGRNIANPVIA
jgi:hypothetical protein